MKYSILLLFTLIFIGCEETKKTSYSMLKNEQVATQIKTLEHPGKKLMETVKRFGVMPKQAFPEETVKQIAEYMFENNIDEPKWFKEHFNKKGNRKKQ